MLRSPPWVRHWLDLPIEIPHLDALGMNALASRCGEPARDLMIRFPFGCVARWLRSARGGLDMIVVVSRVRPFTGQVGIVDHPRKTELLVEPHWVRAHELEVIGYRGVATPDVMRAVITAIGDA